MLTTPKMSETGPKTTSTSYQISTLPQTPLAEIWTSTNTETCQEEADDIFIIITNVKPN